MGHEVELGDARGDLLLFHAQLCGERRRERDVLRVVRAQQAGVYGHLQNAEREVEVDALGRADDAECAELAVFADGDLFQPRRGGVEAVGVFVLPDDGKAAPLGAAQNFPFGGDDALDGAERFEVLRTDAGDDAVVGADQLAQLGDVSLMPRAHLGDETVILREVDALDRLGDAERRVVGGGRRKDAPALAEDAGEEVFDARFAAAARDGDLNAGGGEQLLFRRREVAAVFGGGEGSFEQVGEAQQLGEEQRQRGEGQIAQVLDQLDLRPDFDPEGVCTDGEGCRADKEDEGVQYPNARGARGPHEGHLEGAAVGDAKEEGEEEDGRERDVRRPPAREGEADAQHEHREGDEKGEQGVARAHHVALAPHPRGVLFAVVARLLQRAQRPARAQRVQQRGAQGDADVFDDAIPLKHCFLPLAMVFAAGGRTPARRR